MGAQTSPGRSCTASREANAGPSRPAAIARSPGVVASTHRENREARPIRGAGDARRAVSNCLFCRIAAGEIPATRVAETPRVLAFRDINPQAPTHVLLIPREHVA